MKKRTLFFRLGALDAPDPDQVSLEFKPYRAALRRGTCKREDADADFHQTWRHEGEGCQIAECAIDNFLYCFQNLQRILFGIAWLWIGCWIETLMAS